MRRYAHPMRRQDVPHALTPFLQQPGHLVLDGALATELSAAGPTSTTHSGPPGCCWSSPS